MTAASITAAAVLDQLADVLDPCSIHNGTRLSFIDLGMVDDVSVDDHGHATVRLLLDDPVCMYLVDIMLGVQQAAERADGVLSASVEIVGDVWSPDQMPAQTRVKIEHWQQVRAGRPALPLAVTRSA